MSAQSPAADPVLSRAALDRLLRPRSVAIVGASERPGALGASVLSNLDRSGFAGAVHLINAKRADIGGRPCLATIDALPDGVDVAVLAIPRAAVVDSVRALAARGVGAAVIFSAGFAEGGEAGLAEQHEIAAIAARSGMVIEGPNCLGLVNHIDRIPLTFVETDATPLGDRPGIGIVSQSGAMAAVLGVTLSSRALGLSFSVSTGNEAASGVEDYVDYLVDDPSTRVIAMIVEQFRKPQRFLAAARRARAAGKTIVLLHPGKSAAARESAATHTGAMAGDYALMRVMVEQAGVVFAETLEELGDIAEIAVRCPALPSGGTAVLGESGAFKALSLDLCEELELALPAIGDADSPALRAALPDFVGVSNPLDLTAQGLVDPDLYARTLSALFADDRFGTIVLGIIQTDPVTSEIKIPPILAAMQARSSDKPVIFAGLDEGAPIPGDSISALRALGIPYFPSTERALRAVKRLTALAERVDAPAGDASGKALPLPTPGGVIPEYRAKQLLAPAGIAFPAGGFAQSAADAATMAAALGRPVALKAQSAELSHKTDAGGVRLGLADEEAVFAGWARIISDVADYAPGLSLDGMLVEAMGERGTELIVGARNDPEWGAVILVGIGGVQAEILKDVQLIPAGASQAVILAALDRLKSAALLHGFRGSPPLDVAAIASLVAALGAVMLANRRIREVDLNPVVVYPSGRGVVALDALMMVDPA